MPRKSLSALCVVLLAAVLAACGSHPAQSPASHCAPRETSLGCVLPPVTAPVPPAPAPAAAANTTAVASRFHSPKLTYGIDFGWGGPSAASMRQQALRFGASYLSYDFSKNWHVAQIHEYQRAGIARVFVWETTATRALSGCLAGTSDALAARAQSAGFARVIYFAVDFEEQPSQVATIAGYFRCAGEVLGRGHVGAYGGYWTVAHLFDEHLIGYGWQTYAWSGGRWDARAQLEQYLNGSSFDRDRGITADYGQTPYAHAAPTRAQLQAQLWHLYRVRGAERRQVAVHSALLTRYGCRPPRRVHIHITRSQLARYRARACPTWKHLGDSEHHVLGDAAAKITALHGRGIR